MGIAMVGMTRSLRPKNMKLGPENYFAFRKMAKAEADNLERWHFKRIAYTPLPDAHGRRWWLASELWLDKSFVTMLNTGWFAKELRCVPRWSDVDGKKVKRDCSLALFKYSKGMGAVDRVNKEAAPCPYQTHRFLACTSLYQTLSLTAHTTIRHIALTGGTRSNGSWQVPTPLPATALSRYRLSDRWLVQCACGFSSAGTRAC